MMQQRPWFAERLLTLEAMLYVALAAFMVRSMPFKTLAGCLGPQMAPAEAVRALAAQDIATDEAARSISLQVGRAVRRAHYRLPFTTLCLAHALAAKAMLRRRGIRGTIHLGVRNGDGRHRLSAHAWVTAGTTGIVGTEEAAHFVPLAVHATPPTEQRRRG